MTSRSLIAAVTSVGLATTFLYVATLAQEVLSEVPEILAAKASKLPEGPHPKQADDNCAMDFAEPKTDAGRLVLQRGWGVLSEARIGDYQLISFGRVHPRDQRFLRDPAGQPRRAPQGVGCAEVLMLQRSCRDQASDNSLSRSSGSFSGLREPSGLRGHSSAGLSR